jgi:hypothetical protein
MSGLIKVGGTWKAVDSISAKVDGAWKTVTNGYTKIGGVWNEFYAPVAGGSYDLLATEILTGSQASVEFTGLSSYASTYQHLQIRATLRSNYAATNDYVKAWFNGVKTSNNYRSHFLRGNGSNVASGAFGETDRIGFQDGVASNNSTANVFSPMVIDILDPFETTKNTTIRALFGNNSQSISFSSGAYFSTSAITSFEIAPWFGSGWVQYSRFSLYGLRSS